MAKQHAARFLTIVNDAKTRVSECTVADVKTRLDAGESFHLIDVREESEYARGRLPGAVHLGKGVIERDVEKLFPDTDTPLVLYCGGGFRSALAADALQRHGLHQRRLDGRRLERLECGGVSDRGMTLPGSVRIRRFESLANEFGQTLMQTDACDLSFVQSPALACCGLSVNLLSEQRRPSLRTRSGCSSAKLRSSCRSFAKIEQLHERRADQVRLG